MKTLKDSDGFSAIHALLVLIVIGIVGFTGWYVWSANKSANDTYNQANSASSAQPVKNKKIVTPVTTDLNFYDCLDKALKFEPGTPPTCSYQGKTYVRAADFTEDDVRGLSKLPASAKSTILAYAKKNFDACKDTPQETSVTRVINTVGNSFVYTSSGCDSGFRTIWANQNSTWMNVAQGQDVPSCEVVDEYKIPKTLLHQDGSPSSDTCATAEHESRQIN